MNLDVVIMAAGKGTRMRSDLPKVLHALKGKPMLQHVMEAADPLSFGLERAKMTVIVGYRGDLVADFIDEVPVFTGVSVAVQEPQLGTGHAVQQAVPELAERGITLILNGDTPLIKTHTLARLCRACEGENLALLTVNLKDPSGYGRIVTDDGHVKGIVEHKDATPDQLAITEVYTGAMAVPTDKLKAWLGRLDNKNAQGEFYLTDIVKMAAEDGVTIVTSMVNDPIEVAGVNSPEQLEELEFFGPVPFDAVSFEKDTWRAVVNFRLQRPDFNSKGAALAFAQAVAEGKRKAENVRMEML